MSECHYCDLGFRFVPSDSTQHILNVGGKQHIRPCRKVVVPQPPLDVIQSVDFIQGSGPLATALQKLVVARGVKRPVKKPTKPKKAKARKKTVKVKR